LFATPNNLQAFRTWSKLAKSANPSESLLSAFIAGGRPGGPAFPPPAPPGGGGRFGGGGLLGVGALFFGGSAGVGESPPSESGLGKSGGGTSSSPNELGVIACKVEKINQQMFPLSLQTPKLKKKTKK
jgi:hypothetical protein